MDPHGYVGDPTGWVDPWGLCGAKGPEPGFVWHASDHPKKIQGVLGGIDPAYLNADSRFGAAFYVAEQPTTALAELAHHGATPTHAIRYGLNPSAMRVLDLTDATTAATWGYKGGSISAATQSLNQQAASAGFNVIRYPSERAFGGINQAVLADFNDILKPISVAPTKP